ncbi:MAG: outer membrane protein assembly factor BamD [Flavobacteriaceae bacterium]
MSIWDKSPNRARSMRVAGIAAVLALVMAAGGCENGPLGRSSSPEGSSTKSSAGFPSLPTLSLPWLKKAPTEDELENTPAGQLFNRGLGYLNENSFINAISTFSQVERLHPYSEYARKSMLLIAYSQYRLDEYDACIAAAQRYITLHPGDEDAAYAQYLIAESYFKQIPSIERDQRGAERALREMTELVEKYPDSEYAPDAREKILIARDQLAGKEMQIGRYYQDRGNYLAALNRYRAVVSNYQTTRHVEEALHRLTETYMALGVVSEAQTAAAVLGHNFPNSEWYKDSFQLLQTGGVRPEENRESWISKAFRKAAAAI